MNLDIFSAGGSLGELFTDGRKSITRNSPAMAAKAIRGIPALSGIFTVVEP